MKKHNKNIDKLTEVVNALANSEILSESYKDHQLVNDIRYKDCREYSHNIEPDWLLVYKKNKKELILLLIEIGSYSDLFR